MMCYKNQGKHVSLFLFLLFPGALHGQSRDQHLLIGTYTSGASEGIYVYKFNSKTGVLTPAYTAAGVANPSFLTASADGSRVYAVNELGGGAEGEVSAFQFDQMTGKLTFINKQAAGGGAPCYLTLSPDGTFLFSANYSGGNVAAFPVRSNGSLGPAAQVVQHQGHSLNPQRQEGPHAHSVVFSPDGKFLFAADLGTDRIYRYHYDPSLAGGPLRPAEPAYFTVRPGGGPRHLIFSADGTMAYVVMELTGEVSVFQYEEGILKPVQQVPMTDPAFNGESGAAEIRLSPDGRYLYASNRGDANEIAIYSVDPATGTLSLEGRRPSGGKTPRNFLITPDGEFLLAANQNSDQVVLFKRDIRTGQFVESGKTLTVGNPVYLLMVPIP